MSDDKRYKDLNATLPNFIKIAGLFVFIVLLVYFAKFGYLGFSNDQEIWAQFGDFIGGVLNPLFAFLAFIALIITIRMQSDALKISKDELKATREELEKSRIAQEKQSKSLELQNRATNQQIFENTFFSLLTHHNIILEELERLVNGTTNGVLKSRNMEVPLRTQSLFNKIMNEKSTFEYNNGIFKKYFMTLFQLLKFIYNEKSIDNKKFYTNLIRVNLETKTLVLLSMNCIDNNFYEYKEFIEKYSFFEHLNLNEFKEKEIIGQYLSKYKESAFGSNKSIQELKAIINSI